MVYLVLNDELLQFLTFSKEYRKTSLNHVSALVVGQIMFFLPFGK